MYKRCKQFRFLVVLASAVVLSSPATSEPTWPTARNSLAIASKAADVWVDDAHLVWIENDDDLDAQGHSRAWGYLFYSESLGAMRSWSVQQGKLQKPQDHSVRAAAPALDLQWIDSNAAVDLVWHQARKDAEVDWSLVSLVLVRGVFDAQQTWVAVFDNGEGPRLHVVLRASNGDLLRRWRG